MKRPRKTLTFLLYTLDESPRTLCGRKSKDTLSACSFIDCIWFQSVFWACFSLALTMSDSKTPVVLRNQVIGMHRAGYSVRKIAEKLAISRGFVQNAICKHKTGKSLEDAPRSGRPSKITPRKKRRLIRNLNTDRSQTSAELGQTTFGNISGISPRCVRRCLFKHGFKKCRASKTPLLTYLQKLRRLRWAAAHKHYDFHKVIFSDEKRFAKRPDGPPGELLFVLYMAWYPT